MNVTFARTVHREEPSSSSQYNVRWDKMMPDRVSRWLRARKKRRHNYWNNVFKKTECSFLLAQLCSAARRGPTLRLKVHSWLLVSCVRVRVHTRNLEKTRGIKRMCEWSDVRGWKGRAGECTGEMLLLFSLKFTVKSCGSRGGGNRDALLDFFLSAFFSLSPSRLSVTEKRQEALTGGNAATQWMREK